MNIYGNLDNMSLADLKAAYDFACEETKQMEEDAKKVNIKPEKIPSYQEVKSLQYALYHILLTKSKDLYKDIPIANL